MSLELGDITFSSSIVWTLGSLVLACICASLYPPGTVQLGLHGNTSHAHLYSQ